jgi:hypothetical protein
MQLRKEAADYILSNKYSERSEEYLYREIKEVGMMNDLDDLAYDRMLDDITEAYWADMLEVERVQFEEFGVPDAFYVEHLADWFEYCDDASDDSFPAISVEV